MPFVVDAASLHKAASDTRATKAEVEGDLQRLSSLAEEIGGSWRGQAATGFRNLMTRFNEDAVKLENALGEIADLLDKQANSHSQNDTEQAQMVNKFNSVLNL